MYSITKELFIATRQQSSSWEECAKLLGTSRSTIFNLRRKFGIPDFKRQSEICPTHLTKTQQDILTGSMLGDGCITKKYKRMNSLFCERHSDKQLGYLKWKFTALQPFSRTIRKELIDGNSLPAKSKHKLYVSHRMETVRHTLFSELEKQWYKRDRRGEYITDRERRCKILPMTLELSSLSIAVWFMDDGRMLHDRQMAIISTDGFSQHECENLCEKLRKFEIKSAVTKGKKGRWEISTSKYSYDAICNLLRTHVPCGCVAYKHKKGA